MPRENKKVTFTFEDSNAPGALERLLHQLALEQLLSREREPEPGEEGAEQ